MQLRAVSAAARIGLSLEPFASEQINTLRDSGGVLHFDVRCGSLGTAVALCVRLDEIHLHRHCPACLRPYNFPNHVEAYGQAAEELQQAKWQTTELTALRGMALARGAHHVHSTCRRALYSVAQQTSSVVGQIEKSCSAIRRQIPAIGESGEMENYLNWAVALTVQPDGFFTNGVRAAESWRRQFEYARGEIRNRGLDGFVAELGSDPEVVSYCRQIGSVRERSPWSVVSINDGAAEGTMLLELCATHHQERRGELFALCPDWAVEAGRMLGGDVEVVGPAQRDEGELVAMYAELARTRPGADSLDAARRLVRGSRRRS